MASKLDLAPLPQFDPLGEPSSLSQHWKSWMKRLQMYVEALDVKEDKQEERCYFINQGKLLRKDLKHYLTLVMTTRQRRKSLMSTFRLRKT